MDHSRVVTEPLAFIEIAGRSTLERTIERYVGIGVEAIILLLEESISEFPLFRAQFPQLSIRHVSDCERSVRDILADFDRQGIENAFVNFCDTYTETDLLDLYYFHREAKQAVTNALTSEHALNLHLVRCSEAQHWQTGALSSDSSLHTASYLIKDYVAHLNHPDDLRSFATALLSGRCERGPSGKQVSPGIWVEPGAEIHRRARIVAPAYIGRGTKLLEDTLVTRFTSIESDCVVDCGTVIENSSVLPHTRIGIWLDVRHSIVNGNRILSLNRDAIVELSDASILRFGAKKAALTSQSTSQSSIEQSKQPKGDCPHRLATPATLQFGTNCIQE